VFFALLIRTLGLVFTGIPMVILASLATDDGNWRESILFALAVTGFCALIFPILLGQPIPLWPRF
jgi:hypothetical protein